MKAAPNSLPSLLLLWKNTTALHCGIREYNVGYIVCTLTFAVHCGYFVVHYIVDEINC